MCVFNDAFHDITRINENRNTASEALSTSPTRPINGEILKANGQENECNR